jgi:hypothetical protein
MRWWGRIVTPNEAAWVREHVILSDHDSNEAHWWCEPNPDADQRCPCQMPCLWCRDGRHAECERVRQAYADMGHVRGLRPETHLTPPYPARGAASLTRFADAFQAANLAETLAGHSVLTIGCGWIERMNRPMRRERDHGSRMDRAARHEPSCGVAEGQDHKRDRTPKKPAQTRSGLAPEWCPLQDSNLRSRLRRPVGINALTSIYPRSTG